MYIIDSILVLEKLSIEKKTDVPHQKTLQIHFLEPEIIQSLNRSIKIHVNIDHLTFKGRS